MRQIKSEDDGEYIYTKKNLSMCRKTKAKETEEHHLIGLDDGHFVQTRWLLLQRLTNYPMCISNECDCLKECQEKDREKERNGERRRR
jgi:hypothetical protein